MASSEDPAAVLEGFMHDAANLPAEISHMMEEIQAKDRELQKHQSAISTKDGSLQKHLKLNGSMSAHPKEKEYSEQIIRNYDLCEDIQKQKIALSEKACSLLDRQVKLLDTKIRELQNDGQLLDGPPIPSIFNRKNAHPDSSRGFFANMEAQVHQPLQATSGNAAGVSHANLTAHRLNSQHHLTPSVAQAASSRLSQLSASANAHLHPRNSAPATPASSAQQLQQQAASQRQRESSAGAIDNKKRRLNLGALPTQSSTLRQSSLGPGTPKAGTPTGGIGRAGSAGPRSAAGQQAAAKKSGVAKKMVPHHQQISKLKGKHLKRGTKRKGMSPSVRSRNNTGDEDDSVLSSAEPSDTDASTATRSRRGGGRASITNKSAASEDEDDNVDVEMGEGDEAEDEQEDDRKYCFCQRVSFGEMVGCENDKCPYEWFHLGCVGLKEAPKDQDVWYCPECRPKFAGGGRK
jgi:inhibitor of growth protein 3